MQLPERAPLRPALPGRPVFLRPRRPWGAWTCAAGLGVALLLGLAVDLAPAVLQEVAPPVAPAVQAQETRLAELEGELRAGDMEGARRLAEAHIELAVLYQGTDRDAEALESARRAVELVEGDGSSAVMASALNRLGVAHWTLAQYDSAVVNLGRASQIAVELGDRVLLGRIQNSLGAAYYQWGHYDLALEGFLRALDLRREVGDGVGEARVLANLGLTYGDWGRYAEAVEVLESAIGLADDLGDPFVQGYARMTLGQLHLSAGALDQADEAFRASLPFYSAGDQHNSRIGMARVHLQRGELAPAMEILNDALVEARAAGKPRIEALALLALAEAHLAAGEHDRAIARLDEGMGLAREWEQRPLLLEMLSLLSETHERRGAAGPALEALRAHAALRDSIFDQGTAQRMAAMETRAETERQERENLRLQEAQAVQEALIRRQRLAGIAGGILLLVISVLAALLVRFNRLGRGREAQLAQSNHALGQANVELQKALHEVSTLKGLIPICAHCKKVRDDSGYWEAVESYISARSEALFSHSICAECGPRMYGADWSPEHAEVGAEGPGSDPS
jgi:tetratricopeptide (TPR) repeat protein